MALTQISTAGVKDDAVTSGKIPADAIGSSEIAANAVGSSELADNAVDTAAIADDAVTTAKINDDAVTSAKLASSSVGSDALGSEVVTTANLANNAVTAAKIGTLTADVDFNDNAKARFGTGLDLQIYHDNNVSHIAENGTGPLRVSTDEFQLMNSALNQTMIYAAQNLAVSLNYNGNTKIQTTNTGATVTGTCTATSFAGDGSNLTGITSTTINTNADNRVITGSGTANTLNGESGLTYNGQFLKVDGSSNDNPLQLDTSNGNGAHMRFLQNGSTKHYVGCGTGFSMGDANDLAFRATDDIHFGTGNSSTAKVSIYNTGEVVKPSQPMFQARNSSGSSITVNTGVIPFQTIINNVGNNYSNSTYRFTAPVTGVYLFYIGWYVISDTNHRLNLRINGSDFTTPYIAGYSNSMGSSIPTFSGCQFLKLTANDYVDAYTTAAFYPYGTHLGWGGYLLG